MRIYALEKKLVKVKDDATNEEPIQNMVSDKDNEIAIMKKQLKLSDVDHVQTLEILAIQKEKEKLIEVIVKLNEQLFSLHQQIKVLKHKISSSSSDGTFAGSSKELARELTDINAKEIELDESRREVSTYEVEINILKEHIGEKERKLKKIQGKM